MDNLIEINQLLEILGYSDLRSVRTWANKNKIPLIAIGKKTYCARNFIDLIIENQINSFVNQHYTNASEVLAAIKEDDTGTIPKLASSSVNIETKKENSQNRKTMSKQAQDFLNQVKTT
jgi:hypothetical protein